MSESTTAGEEAYVSGLRAPATSEAILLTHVAQKLSALEDKLGKLAESRPPKQSLFLEIVKIVLGGWPTLGLVFLFLFYAPVRDALQAIPEKVRAADEIGFPGVSLKSTLRIEASRSGVEGLSDALPYLSSGAIELLLRTDKNTRYGMISYSSNKSGGVQTLWFPSDQELALIGELEQKGLATIDSESRGTKKQGVAAVKALVSSFKKQHPGKVPESPGSRDREGWELETPTSTEFENEIRVYWGTTDLGKRAVDVIIRAVATAVEPKGNDGQKSR